MTRVARVYRAVWRLPKARTFTKTSRIWLFFTVFSHPPKQPRESNLDPEFISSGVPSIIPVLFAMYQGFGGGSSIPVRYGPSGNALTTRQARRSEEHTSELQSRLHLVCRLLLEQ